MIEHDLAVVTADLADVEVDAIVAETGAGLRGGAASSLALRARCGPTMEAEAASVAPIQVGSAVAVAGGRVFARHVILCAVFDAHTRPSERVVTSCLAAALAEAERLAVEALAVPLLAVAPGGVALDWCARETVARLAVAIDSAFAPRRAVLVAANMVERAALDRALAEYLSRR